MHWAMPQKPVLSLPESDTANTASTSDTGDAHSQPNVIQTSVDANDTQTSSHPVSLQDFRRGKELC